MENTVTDRQDAIALENVEVFDLSGSRVRLGSLWSDRTAVLVFLRHFG